MLQNVADGIHLWASVRFKEPRSTYTRTYADLLANLLIYDHIHERS